MGLLEQRQLLRARLAPRGPEVQHDDLALVVGQRGLAVGAEHRQARRRRVDPLPAGGRVVDRGVRPLRRDAVRQQPHQQRGGEDHGPRSAETHTPRLDRGSKRAFVSDGAKALRGHRERVGAAERLAQVIETQRELAAAGGDMETVMRLIAERCQKLTGAEGAMVSLLQGNDMLLTTAATGSAAGVLGAIRPLETSVAKHAISDGRPLLIEDCATDPRVNREPAEAGGRHVADLRAAVQRLARDRRAQRDGPLGDGAVHRDRPARRWRCSPSSSRPR